MKYINANTILPKSLLEELQQYAEGTLLYVPKRPESHKSWGESTGIRANTKARNEKICEAFRNGFRIDELAKSYHLSEETIKKIVYQRK